MSKKVLVIDDDLDMQLLLRELLSDESYRVDTASSADEALELVERFSYDGVLLDLHLEDVDGLSLVPTLIQANPFSKIVVMTAFGSIDRVCESFDVGVAGFVAKSGHPDAIVRELKKRMDHAHSQPGAQGSTNHRDEGELFDSSMIGSSPAMKELKRQILQIADVDATILIQGESGTGKEMVARTIHGMSSRKSGPFDAINCGAIPANLLESELFGYVKGAFTDAKANKKGLFEINSEGILLLDEIGEMPLELQVKLLRVLQEREIRPIGGDRSIKIKTRVICATNRDLEAEVEANRFREDLFYRISVIPLTIPSLRERVEDIPELLEYFIRHFCEVYQRPVLLPSKEDMARLKAYPWPGNIRELQNTVERCVVMSQGQGMTIVPMPRKKSPKDHQQKNAPLDYDEAKEQFEVEFLKRILTITKGNISDAAKLSGKFRSDIYRLLERHNIDHSEFK